MPYHVRPFACLRPTVKGSISRDFSPKFASPHFSPSGDLLPHCAGLSWPRSGFGKRMCTVVLLIKKAKYKMENVKNFSCFIVKAKAHTRIQEIEERWASSERIACLKYHPLVVNSMFHMQMKRKIPR